MAIELTPKIPAATGILEILELGAGKVGGELFLSRFTGNGTIKSGIQKIVAGMAGYAIGGKIAGQHGKMLAGGVVVDGVEDIVLGIMKKNGSNALGGGQAKAWYEM